MKENNPLRSRFPSFAWGATIVLALLYFSLPSIADGVVSDPRYAKYAGKDAEVTVNHLQRYFIYPFGKMVNPLTRSILLVPYLLLLIFCLRYLYTSYRRFWNGLGMASFVPFVFLWLFPNTLLVFNDSKPSKSYGTVGNGRIENAKRVDFSGANFTTYSFLGYLAGRTYAHDRVKQTILDAYEICEVTCESIIFLLGEIGHRHGGRFLPHRTHRNGQSVDFMSPLLKKGKPYYTKSIFKLWGYGWEFDNKGSIGDISIDYETMARHLLATEQAANKNGLRIQKVIFDPVLRPFLLATPTGKKLKHLPFTKNRVIVRHDDHYHIDFAVR